MGKAEYLTPVVTALDKAGELDLLANLEIWESLIAGGVDGLVILGSTGEFFSLNERQKQELIRQAVRQVRGRVKLYVGTGCMAVGDTIALSNFALEAGADAVLVIGPYYFALSDESVEAFYDEVAAGVRGGLMLYNFPDRNQYSISPHTIRNLLTKHQNIVGLKDTVNGVAHTREVLTALGEDYPAFAVYSGFDDTFAHNVSSGGAGCIGGLSNIDPSLFAGWVRAVRGGDFAEIARIQRKVNKLMELYSVGTPFIPVVKRAMQLVGLGLGDTCTKPLLPVTDQQEQQIKEILNAVSRM